MPTFTATPTVVVPTPSVPLDQALRRFTGNALLYWADYSRPVLMLADPDGMQPLSLTAYICPDGYAGQVSWSADGQFIALACANKAREEFVYILSMRSGTVRKVGQGQPLIFVWSPVGHRLLVNEFIRPAGRTYIADAATGATVELPLAAAWSSGWPGYPDALPAFVRLTSQGSALYQVGGSDMAWSPDGSRIALISDGLYVVDADGSHLRELKQANDPALYTRDGWTDIGFRGPPVWSRDGRFLVFGRMRSDNNAITTPSSMFHNQPTRVTVSTGETQLLDPPPAEKIWSPDGTKYIAKEPPQPYGPSPLGVYHADGTLVRTFPDQSLLSSVAWTLDSQEILLSVSLPGEWPIIAVDLAGHKHIIKNMRWIFGRQEILLPISQLPRSRIIAVDLAGHERVITERSGGILGIPEYESPFSPDGTLLAVHLRLNGYFGRRIVLLNIQGGERAELNGELVGWRPGLAARQ